MLPDRRESTSQPEIELTFPVKEFARAVKEVAFAANLTVAQEPPILAKFKQSSLELTATDGNRLSWRNINYKGDYLLEERETLIPARSLMALMDKIVYLASLERSDFVKIIPYLKKNRLELKTNDASVVIPIDPVEDCPSFIRNVFLRWREIIPSTPYSLVFKRKELLEKIRPFNDSIKVEIVPSEITGKVSILSDHISLYSEQDDFKKKFAFLNIAGFLPHRLIINSQFLGELLSKVTSTKELVLQISDKPDQPLVFRKPYDEDFLHLIMPMLS